MNFLNHHGVYSLFFILSIKLNLINTQSIYNFVNSQNYEIDLNYKYLPGTNMYFFPEDNSSLFITTVDPDLELKISMQLYTNDTKIIDFLRSEGNLYFGIDFRIPNTDITIPNYRSDIILCKFNLQKVLCNDYAYNLKEDVYEDNTNSRILKNNLIPIGFNSTNKVIFNENVLYFHSYYSISFEKIYPPKFDNVTMFKYFYTNAEMLNASLTAFYGMEKGSLSPFSLNNAYFYSTQSLLDGEGLNNENFYIFYNIKFILFIFLILY
jgi:hypothetical protein